jgi:hypothetical protein
MTHPALRTRHSNALGNKEEDLVPVNVKYEDTSDSHLSLAHFWSEWYRLYMDADYPRIIVRFEDLLFYGEEVTEGESPQERARVAYLVETNT